MNTLELKKTTKAAFIRHAVANGLALAGVFHEHPLERVVVQAEARAHAQGTTLDKLERSEVVRTHDGFKRKIGKMYSYMRLDKDCVVYHDGIHWVIQNRYKTSSGVLMTNHLVYL